MQPTETQSNSKDFARDDNIIFNNGNQGKFWVAKGYVKTIWKHEKGPERSLTIEFRKFLETIDAAVPAHLEVHLILVKQRLFADGSPSGLDIICTLHQRQLPGLDW